MSNLKESLLSLSYADLSELEQQISNCYYSTMSNELLKFFFDLYVEVRKIKLSKMVIEKTTQEN